MVTSAFCSSMLGSESVCYLSELLVDIVTGGPSFGKWPGLDGRVGKTVWNITLIEGTTGNYHDPCFVLCTISKLGSSYLADAEFIITNFRFPRFKTET